MTTSDFKYKKEISSPVEAVLFSNFNIDDYRLAVILNSRQSKTPFGDDPWIVNSIKAVKHAAQNDYIVITSTGMNTWELICWACGNVDCRQIIVCPICSNDEIDSTMHDISKNFSLNHDKIGWLFFKFDKKTKSVKSSWPTRDKLAVSLADILIPISIRPGGNLEKLVDTEKGNNKTIVDDFKTGYTQKKRTPQKMPECVSESLKKMSWNYITHWTRTCYGCRPGETKGEFYLNLANSNEYYPNNALNILKNILVEKCIRSSTNNLRQGIRAVAFSSHHPKDVLSLMSWRKRYVRWNFEPYGVAIAREAAVRAEIQPVIYGKPELYKKLLEPDKPFFQNEGEANGNWREEKEWRFPDDLHLSQFSSDELKIIVGKPDEIEFLSDITDSEIISFT